MGSNPESDESLFSGAPYPDDEITMIDGLVTRIEDLEGYRSTFRVSRGTGRLIFLERPRAQIGMLRLEITGNSN